MGRDLHDGYSVFIEAARMGFGGREFVNTNEVAQLIGCGKGHALVVMRSIPDTKCRIDEINCQYWLSTAGDFTPAELAGWVQAYQRGKKHAKKVEKDPVMDVAYVGNSLSGLLNVIDVCHRRLDDHNKRISALEEKIRSGKYVEPVRNTKRRFFGLFS